MNVRFMAFDLILYAYIYVHRAYDIGLCTHKIV